MISTNKTTDVVVLAMHELRDDTGHHKPSESTSDQVEQDSVNINTLTPDVVIHKDGNETH